MTAQEYFDSQSDTDANSVIDIYAHKYSRFDIIRFAQAYHNNEQLLTFNIYTTKR